MKNLQTAKPIATSIPTASSTPTRLAAILAVTAGLLTGALWPAGPLDRLVSRHDAAVAAGRIDPAIPALTIVAKKLSAAEKRAMAREDAVAVNGSMLNVSVPAVPRAAADTAF